MARCGLCLRHRLANLTDLCLRFRLCPEGQEVATVITFTLDPTAATQYDDVVQIRFPFNDRLLAVLATYFERNLPGATWLSTAVNAGAAVPTPSPPLFDPEKDVVLLQGLGEAVVAIADELTAGWDALMLLAGRQKEECAADDSLRRGLQRWLWLLEEWRVGQRLCCTQQQYDEEGGALLLPCILTGTPAQWERCDAVLASVFTRSQCDEKPHSLASPAPNCITLRLTLQEARTGAAVDA